MFIGCPDGGPSPSTDGSLSSIPAEFPGRPEVHIPATVGTMVLPLGAGATTGVGMAPWMSAPPPEATRSATATASPAVMPSAIPAATVTSASCQRRTGAAPEVGGRCVAALCRPAGVGWPAAARFPARPAAGAGAGAAGGTGTATGSGVGADGGGSGGAIRTCRVTWSARSTLST